VRRLPEPDKTAQALQPSHTAAPPVARPKGSCRTLYLGSPLLLPIFRIFWSYSCSGCRERGSEWDKAVVYVEEVGGELEGVGE
jgi:hypothetical protein